MSTTAFRAFSCERFEGDTASSMTAKLRADYSVTCDISDERFVRIRAIALVAIAKGPDRDAGRERFFSGKGAPYSLPFDDPVLYFLQRLRDEAHRFAIETHRAKRIKSIGQSKIDDVPGIGAKRKKALLHHFGSSREVSRAGLQDLEAVDGISKVVAKKIYDFFHDEA